MLGLPRLRVARQPIPRCPPSFRATTARSEDSATTEELSIEGIDVDAAQLVGEAHAMHREAARGHSHAGMGAWSEIPFDEVRVGRRVGGGKFTVYRGWWRGRQVALKAAFKSRASHTAELQRPGSASRERDEGGTNTAEDSTSLRRELLSEIFLLSDLRHPNIVRLLGAVTAVDRTCVVLEWCSRSLHELLHVSAEPLNGTDMLEMAIDIASAMQYVARLMIPVG